MMQEVKRFQISIFGESYTIISDEAENEVLTAVSLVDSLMKETASKSAVIDHKKVAIFVALKLATKMLNLESETNKIKEKGDLLIKMLDQEL